MKNELMIFEGNNVEILELDGVILFNPKDVAKCLDILDVNSSIRDFNENQVVKLTNSDMHSMQFRKLNNAGEKFLTEKGVYKLVFKSRKEEALKFQDWVYDEVLPTIRKTGGYINNDDLFVETYLPFADETTKMLFKNTLEIVKKQNETIQIMQPKADYFDDLVERNLLTNIRDTAKELKIKQKTFVNWLIESKYVYRDSKGSLKPYADFTPSLFEIKEFSNGGHAGTQTLVTPKGRETFRLLIKN